MKLSLLLLSSVVGTSNAMDASQTDQSSSQGIQQLSEQPVTHPATAETTSPDTTLLNPATLLEKAALKMSETVWTAQQDSLLRRLEAQESSENIQSDLTNTLKDKLTLLATVCKLAELEEATSINIPEVINQKAQLKSQILMDRLKEIYDNRRTELQSNLPLEEESSLSSGTPPIIPEITPEAQPADVNAPNYDNIINDAANRFAELFITKNTEIIVKQLEENEMPTSSSASPNVANLEQQIEEAANNILLQAITQINPNEAKKIEIQDKIKREARRIRQQVMDHTKEIKEKKKVERELNRIADQIAAEYERVAPKVKRETQRIGNQIAAEYERVAPKVERETQRIADQIAAAPKKAEKEGKKGLEKMGLRKKKNK
ncbi:MAG: hypothetical protein K0M45_05955 [Candidatus Paracaedibacteraceae bacterium]|nr:hypothetical protein [Candidatus Paracaedibacteraceae bacterium]